MIQIVDLGPAVIGYSIDGKIVREDIENAFAEVDQKLESPGKLRVYVELHSLEGITLDALARDLRLGLQRLDLFPRLEKVALVSDQGWLRSAVSMPDRLLPGVEVRTFTVAESPQARVWIQA